MASPSLPPLSGRILTFYMVLGVSVIAIIWRMFDLQILNGSTYIEQAFENKISRVSDPAPRGIIYDNRGVVLARNIATYIVTIIPAELPDEDLSAGQLDAIYLRLSQLLNMPITIPGSTPRSPCVPGRGIRDLVIEQRGIAPYSAVKIKCDIDREVALVIREEEPLLPGVHVIVEPVRDYPHGELMSAIVGYMAPIPDPNESEYFKDIHDYYVGRGLLPGRDRIGVSGVEASMQDVLAGLNGSKLQEVDVAGLPLRVVEVETDTVPGQNVQLTIDSRLQAAAEAALTARVRLINNYWAQFLTDQYNIPSGVAIAMNPNTGEVLALVSWPSYDNNRFARFIDAEYYLELAADPLHPLINHAVAGLYPPGSVFKMVTAAGVLEENVIDPYRKLEDPGFLLTRNKYYPNDPGKAQRFVCWIYRSTNGGHGPVDFIRGIADSCDVYFYKVGGGWAPDKVDGLMNEERKDGLAKWMELFGFGQRTGIELPGESRGVVPTSKWKRINYGENWSTGDTYNAVIGQGYVLVTPMQMINSINAIANGGTLYRATLVDKILDGEGHVISDTQPEALRHLPITAEHLKLLNEGMRGAVVYGTLKGEINKFGDVGNPIIEVPEGINVGGKTGTAEYCDEIAWDKGLCEPGKWPAHAWTYLYAPYEKPEISVIVMMYNGSEGSLVAGPIASAILRAYFNLKAVDSAAPVTVSPN